MKTYSCDISVNFDDKPSEFLLGQLFSVLDHSELADAATAYYTSAAGASSVEISSYILIAAEPKQTYTKNEQQVFNTIAEISMSGSVADINDIVSDELPAKAARGVISSLVKKGRVHVEEIKRSPFEPSQILYWAIEKDNGACFWCDCLSEAEAEAQYIQDSEVK